MKSLSYDEFKNKLWAKFLWKRNFFLITGGKLVSLINLP